MSNVTDLPRHLREPVVREFQGERILWTGRPRAGLAFRAALLIWLFAIPWTAFTMGWETMALSGWLSGKPAPSGANLMFGIVFPLFGLPFVLVGLGMMAAPFYAYWWAGRTAMVIGEKRLAMVTVGRRLRVKSYRKETILRTERTERADGSGTLKVITGARRDSEGDRVESSETLYGIADVRAVERLLCEPPGNGQRAA
jgi:hypothetical protein